MAHQSSGVSESVDDEPVEQESDDQKPDEPLSTTESSVPNIGLRLARRWKLWGVAFVMAATSYVLYGIGGWTIDATTFALAALVLVLYGLWSVSYDLD